MTNQWQQPANWEDFEEMCFCLVIAEGKEASLQKYGRHGQRQYGLDIVGNSMSSRSEWVGYQCKLKTEHLGSKLQEKEIIEEYKKSKQFSPALTRLIFATTSPRDNIVQDAVNRLNASAHRKHEVGIWWWENIASLLNKHSSVAARFYPHFFPDDYIEISEQSISISLGTSDNFINRRIDNFFKHPLLKNRFGTAAKQVNSAILETISNVLSPSKGGALRVEINFDGEMLRIADNGFTFNPFDMSFKPNDGQFGIEVIRSIKNLSGLEVLYQSKNPDFGVNLNELIIKIVSPINAELSPICSQHVSAGDLFFRSDIFTYIDNLKIPNDCDPYTLIIGGHIDGVSISACHQLIHHLRRRLGNRKLRFIVSGKSLSFVSDFLRVFARHDQDVEIIQDDS